MKIITDLGTAENIKNKEYQTQSVEIQCHICKNKIKIPIKGGLVDYRAAYEQMRKRFLDAVNLNSKLKRTISGKKK